MKRTVTAIAFGAAASLVASPILAQRGGGDRPSRQCMQEIMQLCSQGGRPNRDAIRSCVQSRIGELSNKCQEELQQRVQQRANQAREGGAVSFASAKADRTVFYGSDQRQQIDIFEPEGAVDDLPLVLFIHGGGWRTGSHKAVQAKPAHFTKANYYFASTGYRLLPDAPVEEQAKDIGTAIQALRGQAGSIGFDADRIVLMGHSAGAHLAALVATDPQYAGDAFAAIQGVVLLDGAGYDVAANMASAEGQARFIYSDAFGDDPARQAALSPISYVGGPDAPHWLALYVEERGPAKAQAEMLVSGLSGAGANASAVAISGTDHGRVNRELGTEQGAQQTQAVDAFLAQLFG